MQFEKLLFFFPHRYLHKEFAESWSVPRLAEGFDVSTDVIRRVLKSKFVPTLEQKLRQDQKVLKKAGITGVVRQLPVSEDTLKPLSAGRSLSGPLLAPGDEVSKSQNHSTALKVVKSNIHSTDAQKKREGRVREFKSWKKAWCLPPQPWVIRESFRSTQPVVPRLPEELTVVHCQVLRRWKS